ncbi:helix-turn-helix domain-containing protein [Streptomyces sp. NPDC058417]|uniref:helix-turn-helix domain-containing protein n=1 Tax=unclassified Streptomyces TaxID=2593676 RepID=UPI0036462961
MTRGPSSPAGARLAAALRELRDRTGLSLAGLAAATTYSKSSWERYLNGRTVPPQEAVRELCRLAGEPAGRCLALREITLAEWTTAPPAAPPPPTAPSPAESPPAAPASPSAPASPEAAEATPPAAPAPAPSTAPSTSTSGAPGSAPGARAHRSAAVLAVLASVCAVVMAAVVAALLLAPGPGDAARPSPSPSDTGPLCRGTACEGGDPMAMRCADRPDTLAEHVTATGASVQLRRSRVCGAGWGRMWGGSVGDRIEMTVPGTGAPARTARVRDGLDADGYVYTPMSVFRPGTAVRACFLPAGGGPAECFDAGLGHPGTGS